MRLVVALCEGTNGVVLPPPANKPRIVSLTPASPYLRIVMSPKSVEFPVEATVINAGINAQAATDATVRLQLGPMGLETYDSSEDMEGYADEAAAVVAGWATSDDCNTTYSTCSNWGYYGGDPGFVMNTDEGDGDETNSWGSDGDEFQTYYGGGSVSATTPTIDFSGAASDLTFTMVHRYNFDYYEG